MDTRFRCISKAKRRGIRTTLPALALAPDLPDWLAYTTIVLAILAAAWVYLWPSPLEFPMDDSYIHFVYAENLSERGELYFNTPDEVGVGTSSLLWVLILAAGNWAGLSMHWVAKLAGILCLAGVGIGLYRLLRPLRSPWAALACALLAALSGHMLWFALSGMETMLFLALGILALLCYREERWAWLGLALGLLVITRLEGILLALAIGGVDIWRRKAIRRGLLVAAGMCGLICIPWVLYLWLRTGYFLPTSGIGRHFSNLLSLQAAGGRSELLAWLSRTPALTYVLEWTGYSIEFVLGGFALPAPYLSLNPGLAAFSFRLSIWAILGLATVIIPLLWLSSWHLARFLHTPVREKDRDRAPLLTFLLWAALHNLSYMIYLPMLGAASRYAALNHIALWLALGLGVGQVRQLRYRVWFSAGLLVIALVNTAYWNRVYDANLEHMLQVRIAAAGYLREQIPTGETCAAFDVGALRYYSRRPLVDLGGLIDPHLIDWVSTGRFDRYLVENGVTCLAIPGRTGTSTDGVLDIINDSGLGHSRLYDLQQVKVFQIDHRRWLVGYLPTLNYQATVTIYILR